MTSNEAISKAEAARRWGVSKAAVTKYVHAGLPTRDDGQLDWPRVDSWRKRFVGLEPLSPRVAREAKAQRATPIRQSAEDEALEEARQQGRWEMLQALTGPEATTRTLKVMLKLGLTPKHALFVGLWTYFGILFADPNGRDCDGPGGGVPEPDWVALLPATKQRLNPDTLGAHVIGVAEELFETK